MKIEAFFKGIKNANEAADKLKSQGIKAYADINDHFQLNTDVRPKEEGFLSTTSNSDLVMNSGIPDDNTGRSPLLAASPMVSGMGGFEEIADINYKVIISTDANNKQKAEEIIKSLGGTMESPNLNIQKHVKDIDLSKADPEFLKDLE
ncbi:MAG: hypothetical protein K0R54_1959 [Clostridiaceae bacterium]|jgi:hypothetical protein|nr:hypothetical protein [Clostridiaceae bacterium]